MPDNEEEALEVIDPLDKRQDGRLYACIVSIPEMKKPIRAIGKSPFLAGKAAMLGADKELGRNITNKELQEWSAFYIEKK